MDGLLPHPASTAPKDGRVYRGYFERPGPRGAIIIATSWTEERGWVDLEGHEIGAEWRLSAWTPEPH